MTAIFVLVGGSTETLAHYFPEIKNDLTKVTWEHGVNSKEKMEAALKGNVLFCTKIVRHRMIEVK